MLTNHFAEWQTVLDAQLVASKCTDKDVHVIIYTDGGCRPNPGPGGIGIHGYFFTKDVPKTGYGTKGFKPTDLGYVNTERPVDDPNSLAEHENQTNEPVVRPDKPVTVLGFFDIAMGLEGTSTNNSAELSAFIHGLLILNSTTIKSATFIMDSRYVLNNTEKFLSQWARNQWRGSDGSEIKNRYLWESIHELKTKLDGQIPINLVWTKGHSDDAGNIRADINATTASIMAMHGTHISQFRLFPPRGYWNPDSEYHRFFTENRWYFLTNLPLPQYDTALGRFHAYYTGNHGTDDDMFGKGTADTCYSVIGIREPDSVLAQLKLETELSLAASTMQGVNMPVIAQLNNIFKPIVYRDLQLTSCKNIFRPQDKPVIFTPPEILLCTKRDPPLLAARAYEHLSLLEKKLVEFCNRDLPANHRLTNVTELIYEQVITKKKTVLKVAAALGMDFQTLKTPVTYTHGDTEDAKVVTLTAGIDIPKRNLFTALTEKNPQVFILSWPELSSRKAFRYATVVVCDDAIGIWAGVYSNLCLVI